jgi:glycosyltransferase involved in cell wall biosynthesis
MAQMKVAILVDKLIPASAPKVVCEEARYLNELGHIAEVAVITKSGMPEKGYSFEDFLTGVPIKYFSEQMPFIKYLDFKLPFFSFLSGFHVAAPFLIPMSVKEKEYDVCVSHYAFTWFTAYQLWRRRRIPCVNYHWDPLSYLVPKVYSNRLPKRTLSAAVSLAAFIDKFMVKNSLVTVTGSQLHASQLKKLTGNNVEVIYPGCFPMDSIPEKRGDYLLAIDRWDLGNMPYILLDVMEKLRRKTMLLIAGFWHPSSAETSFVKLIKKRNLTKWVRVLGPVSEIELAKLYLNARALLHPIEESSASMPALEAAAHGCPIIMPKGTTEPFTHGIHGFFPRVGNLAEYIEYVDTIISDEGLAYKMGHEAWNVAKKHSWAHHAKRLEETIMRYI